MVTQGQVTQGDSAGAASTLKKSPPFGHDQSIAWAKSQGVWTGGVRLD